uniref:Putative restriction endonuclease domain-containing protein n=1 Tax=uncultured Thiotrichaceae bacterium TaxID=298394 RepID=A0A6S6TE84_9GAMM|nr:MAG: Unknown protein [uncultured Thiotrichaceae bacterium]
MNSCTTFGKIEMPPLAENINYISVKDYLAGEPTSEVRHEYVNGQVFAMAGAKTNHNRITRNLTSLLWSALADKPCEPFSSDMLLKTAEDKYRYPDVIVVCDEDEADNDYVQDKPVLIVEVLSKSTRRQDKTEKRNEYIALPCLQEYILIEQDIAEVEIQRRKNHWQPEYFYLGQDILLESVGVTVSVEEIYQRVDNGDVKAYLEKKTQNTGDTAT